MADLRIDRPLVTIVTITFNLVKNKRVEMFDQCVRSVHSQTYSPIEHIVIDGASTDGTIQLLEKYQKKGWIRYLSEPDSGIYDAMNKGINRAKGKYIAFLNTDDYYHSNTGFEKVIQQLEKTSGSVLYSDVHSVDCKTNKTVGIWYANIDRLVFGTHFCHQGVIACTDVLRKYPFDTKLKISADSDQTIRMVAKKVPFIKADSSFAAYRSGGFSNLNPDINRREHSSSFCKHIGRDFGLSKQDCYMLWNFSLFFELPLPDALRYFKRLTKIEWQYEFLLQFASMLEVGQLQLIPSVNQSNPFTSSEVKLISFYRRAKHVVMPENGLVFRIIRKLKTLSL